MLEREGMTLKPLIKRCWYVPTREFMWACGFADAPLETWRVGKDPTEAFEVWHLAQVQMWTAARLYPP